MKIKELIEILLKHPNQDAIIEITANSSHNGEDELMDIKLNELAVFNEDDFYTDFVELFAYQINPIN
jgi:hypothetical protein